MESEGVGLISVLQRIAMALEDMDSILAVLTEETMDMQDTIKVTNATLIAAVDELKIANKLATNHFITLHGVSKGA